MFKVEVNIRDEKTLELIFDGEKHTIPGLIVDYLNRMPDVEFAGYDVEHPLRQKSKLIVKFKKGKASKRLLDVLEKIKRDFNSLLNDFESQAQEADRKAT